MSIPKRPYRSIDSLVDYVEPPVWLCGNAKIVYEDLFYAVSSMRVLEATDLEALSLFADQLNDYQQACIELQSAEALVKGRDGTTVRNPLIILKNTALGNMGYYIQMFGMSPSARAQLGITKDVPSELDAFMKKGNNKKE